MDWFFMNGPIKKYVNIKINKEWHLKHQMPKNPTCEQRASWHVEHQKHCSCRPINGKLAEEMRKGGIKF
jgi:hypothetical protein